jgi:hypothetical protein
MECGRRRPEQTLRAETQHISKCCSLWSDLFFFDTTHIVTWVILGMKVLLERCCSHELESSAHAHLPFRSGGPSHGVYCSISLLAIFSQVRIHRRGTFSCVQSTYLQFRSIYWGLALSADERPDDACRTLRLSIEGKCSLIYFIFMLPSWNWRCSSIKPRLEFAFTIADDVETRNNLGQKDRRHTLPYPAKRYSTE